MHYRIDPDFVLLSVAGENLLVKMDRRFGVIPKATALNDTAAHYWSMLTEGLDEDAMLKRMKALCNPNAPVSEAGLMSFIASLEKVGAIAKDE